MMRLINSPFNFAGNKLELLPQLHKYFPKDIEMFIDVFAGSGSVFVNTPADRYLVNDKIQPLIYFMRLLHRQANNLQDINTVEILEKIRDSYNLLKTNTNFKKQYYFFRDKANIILKDEITSNATKGILFYLLLCCCHNNLIRFNKSMEFNQTFGNRTFNDSMKNKLIGFMDALNGKHIVFTHFEFDLLFSTLQTTSKDFLYCDPPYLISEAGYNILWNREKEKVLYDSLDYFHSINVRWGLSNISIHKNAKNDILNNWMTKYRVIPIEKNYLKVAKKKVDDTVEVYVCNYDLQGM